MNRDNSETADDLSPLGGEMMNNATDGRQEQAECLPHAIILVGRSKFRHWRPILYIARPSHIEASNTTPRDIIGGPKGIHNLHDFH